jgi:hypothetical protein
MRKLLAAVAILGLLVGGCSLLCDCDDCDDCCDDCCCECYCDCDCCCY